MLKSKIFIAKDYRAENFTNEDGEKKLEKLINNFFILNPKIKIIKINISGETIKAKYSADITKYTAILIYE